MCHLEVMSGRWTQVSIAGKTADVYESGAGTPRFGVLDLHVRTLQTLRHRPAFTRWFEHFGLVCICPHGGASWWTDRVWAGFDVHISTETYLLESVLPYFRERWGLSPPAIAMQGLSMGGQAALRLAFKHPGLFPVVGAISPTLDYHELYDRRSSINEIYDSKEQCRQDTAIMHIPPAGAPRHIFFCVDPKDAFWYRGNDRLHEKLNALGIPHEIDFTTEAGGHSWRYFDHMAERLETFIHNGLVAESRRLL
jgi:S-formylglutathione hydrolase FrmB